MASFLLASFISHGIAGRRLCHGPLAHSQVRPSPLFAVANYRTFRVCLRFCKDRRSTTRHTRGICLIVFVFIPFHTACPPVGRSAGSHCTLPARSPPATRCLAASTSCPPMLVRLYFIDLCFIFVCVVPTYAGASLSVACRTQHTLLDA